MPGSFHVPDWQDHADFIQVMITTVCELTWRLLPNMRERGHGFIVNVASIAGRIPLDDEATYSATKFALRVFSFALAEELRETNVRVAVVGSGSNYAQLLVILCFARRSAVLSMASRAAR